MRAGRRPCFVPHAASVKPPAKPLKMASPGKPTRTGLRQRRVFVVVVLACMALVGLQAWREWAARGDQILETDTSLVNLASALVQHAEDTFDMADAVLVNLVAQVEAEDGSPDVVARLDRLLTTQLATGPGVRDFVIFDEGGNWLATSMRAKGGNNADRGYFRRHRDDPDRGMHIGSLIRSRSNGPWSVTLSRRWQHADGRFAGVVLALIDLSHFVDHFASFDLGPGSSITLDTTEGILLARRPFAESDVGRDMSNAPVFSAAHQNPVGSYRSVSIIDGVQRFVGYRRSARYPLLVVAAMSADHALASWRADIRLYLASATVLSVVGLLCLYLIRQVGRRQAAEDQARTSEARYRLVAENSSDLIIVKPSFDGPRAYVSPACRAMLGYEPEELATLPIERHVHPDDLERVAAEYAGLVLAAPTVVSVHRLRHQAGHWVWVETVFNLVADGGGQSVILTAHDITARRRLEAERAVHERELARSNADLQRLAEHLEQARDRAERASQAKSRFLAGMSHELRTPLNGVLGYAQLLRLEGGLNATQLGRVDSMLGAGSHLLQMINCVLDLSEIEAEHVTLRMAAVDLHGAAKVCLDLVRSAAEAKQLTLRCVVAPGLPTHVTTDATRLRQVLLNLLGNAVKFTARGGVTLRLGVAQGEHQGGAQGGDQDAATLRLEVADTGPGISAEQRHRLFQDFDRLDVEETSTVEGTGLGLAISARLAVLLGGRLGHEDNPGGGSVFWLELPAEPAPGMEAARQDTPSTAETAALLPATALERPPGARTAARALRVLVADDVLMNRDIAHSFLAAAGHEVVLAENGAEAVARASAEPFDVILMDVRMPVMNGFDAAIRIRALKGPRGRVPIVALTAQSFTGQIEESRRAGMDAHLTKPFTPDTLLEAVAHWAVAGRRPGGGLPMHEAVPADAAPAPSTGTRPDEPDAELASEILDTAVFEQTAALLDPETVSSYLRTLAEQGEALMHDLHAPDALAARGNQLAEAAHALAGSAGLFGFGRLAAAGRGFEHAVQEGTTDARSTAENLADAVAMAIKEIHRRVPVSLIPAGRGSEEQLDGSLREEHSARFVPVLGGM